MTSNQDNYTIAGWLAITSAILLIPEIGLAILGELVSPSFNLIIVPIHILNTLIALFLLFMLKKLLNNEFNFTQVDTLILVMMLANILFSLIGLVGYSADLLGIGGIKSLTSIVTVVLFVPYNVLVIVFGVQIQKLENDLFGLLKPYAYTMIGSGICGATLILAPIGLLFAIIALVIEGMIFLRVHREAEIL